MGWGSSLRGYLRTPADQGLALGFADVENQATETPDLEVCTKQRLVQSFCRTPWGGRDLGPGFSTTSGSLLTPAPTQGSCLALSGARVGKPWGLIQAHIQTGKRNGFWGPEMLTLPPQPMDPEYKVLGRRDEGLQ